MQLKSLILNSELFHSVWRQSIRFTIAVFAYNTRNCWVQIYTWRGAKSSILNCKPVQEHSYRCLAIPNIYTITTLSDLLITMPKHGQKATEQLNNNIVS